MVLVGTGKSKTLSEVQMLNWRRIGNGILLVLLIAGCLSFSGPVQAIIWYQIKFTAQVHEWEMDVVRDFYDQRLKFSQSEFPDRPVEILVGRVEGNSEGHRDHIDVYLRGNPEFCSKEGCFLSRLKQDEQGQWRSEFELLSNGYLMITDIGRGGRLVLVTETNTRCLNLVWNETVYEHISAPGPCEDRQKAALGDAIDDTIRNVRSAFRKNKISYYGGVVPQGATVTVSIEFETDRSKARTLLSDIAAKNGGIVQTDGNSFSLKYDFSHFPRFFVLE